jgi:hypothetical protein
MSKKYGFKEVTYHSWQEYAEKNPGWDRTIGTRLAAAFARDYLEKDGIYVAREIDINWNSRQNRRVHEAVSNFLKRLHAAEESARNSTLRFDVRAVA